MPTSQLLRVRGLTHAYGSHKVLSNVSLDVPAGRAVAVIGHNGAGKSTLLRCVVGAQRPTSGQVLLDGAPLDETRPEVRVAVAAVLDDLEFFPDLTAVEHLDLLARAHGVPDPDETVDEVLAELGLTGAGDQFPGTLSSGQRRRLALATPFVRPHRLLVLDEPEQRLDTEGREWLVERLLAEKKRGVGLLLASHAPDVVERIADRVVTIGAVR